MVQGCLPGCCSLSASMVAFLSGFPHLVLVGLHLVEHMKPCTRLSRRFQLVRFTAKTWMLQPSGPIGLFRATWYSGPAAVLPERMR